MKSRSFIRLGCALVAILSLSSAVSCNKETDPKDNPGGDDDKYLSSFTAELKDYTKASVAVSDGKVSWEEGDSVAVMNGIESSIFVYDSKSGTFQTSAPLLYTDGFNAVYPASVVSRLVDGGFEICLEPTNSYSAGCVKRAPMWASSQTDNFKFSNLCAIFAVGVNSKEKFRSMSFTSAGKPVSGTALVRNGELTMNDGGATTIRIDVPEEYQSTDGTSVFFILPAQMYAGGFSLSLNYSENGTITESADKDMILSPGFISSKDAFAQMNFSGGAGTMANPWKISSVEDLVFLSENSNQSGLPYCRAYYEQTCDIDFGGSDFTAIGTNVMFSGTFNGNGCKIKNFNAVTADKQPLGLFATVGPGGVVCNLTLDNATFSGTSTRVGGIVGYLNGGTVKYCMTTATCTISQTSSKQHELGGIVGTTQGEASILSCCSSAKVKGACGNVGGIAGTINSTSKIKNCSTMAECTVEGGSSSESGCNVGGIVGYVSGVESYTNTCEVINCTSSAAVTGHYCDNGGIVGRLNQGKLAKCSFDGTVSCDFNDSNFTMATGTTHSNTGGIVGWVSGKSSTVFECYSQASVSAQSRFVGGVVGFADNGNIHDCHFENGTVEGVAYVGGIAGCLYNYGVASCSVIACTITSSNGYGGGIAGYDYACMISDCKFGSGSKLLGGGSKKHRFGGIAGEGYGYAAIIKDCTIEGEISPSGGIVGGAVGYLDYGLVRNTVLKKSAVVTSKDYNIVGGIAGQFSSHGGYVFDCTAEKGAKVYGKTGCQYLGGIVGYVEGSSQISGCYSSVDISTGVPAGGIVGYMSSTATVVANCLYYDGAVQAESSSSPTACIVGQINSSSTQNIIVNCAAYPSEAGAGVKGICANSGSARIVNCYSPTDGGSEPALTALNDGASAYNNNSPLYAIRAESWVPGTNGKPVQIVSPIATEYTGPRKTRVALLGDSISTFTGWTPYPKGNGYPLAKWPDVTTVDQVYWHILIYDKMTDCELDVNSAYSGSCVMETTTYGYPGRGFLHRYTDLKSPDIILINGGTNDCMYAGKSLPMGKLDFDLADEQLDLYSLAGAYDMLIRKLKVKFPKAKIAIICGDYPGRFRPQGKQIILDIAEHYNLPYAVVEFDDVAANTEGDDIHPNANGHKVMADQIWAQLKDKI